MDDITATASALIEEVVGWLRENYGQFEFWVERDLVWTVQTRLRAVICERRLPFQVFNDYPMLPGPRRWLSANLVIRGPDAKVAVAAEFKYEPSHRRTEFRAMPGKLPVVFWGAEGVAKDVKRIRDFVEAGAAEVAFSFFIDEGRHFRGRPAHPGSAWRDWNALPPDGAVPSVLWARWPQA
jgi:hypothetical protein